MPFSVCRRIFSWCVWLCLFAVTQRSVVAQEYPIKGDRLEQVGNVYSVVIKGTREGSIIGIEGDVPLPETFTTKQTHKISAELDATILILDTDQKGRVLMQSISVNRFQFDTDVYGEDVDLDGKQWLVHYDSDPPKIFVDGKEVVGHNVDVLQFLLGFHWGGAGTERMIGGKRQVRIGDNWELDEKSVDIRSILPEFSPDDEILYGELKHRVAKLSKLESVRGIDCLQINAEWISENPLTASFPEGGKIAKSDVRLSYSGLFLVNPSLRCLRSERKLEWSVDIELTNGIVKGAIVRQTLTEKLVKEVKRS